MQASAEKIWCSAQGLLRSMLSAEIYNLWFAPIRAVALEGDCLSLEVANEFYEIWLKENYLGLIRDALVNCAGQTLKVKFLVNNALTEAPTPSDGYKSKAKAQIEFNDRSAAGRDAAFNPKNTFDTFVAGADNTFAH